MHDPAGTGHPADRSAQGYSFASARRSRRQFSGFRKTLHVPEPRCKQCCPLSLILFTRSLVRQHRIIVHEGIEDLRCACRHRSCLNRAVIKIVRLARLHRLRVGVGKLGPSYQDFVSDVTPEEAHGADFAVVARDDLAGKLKRFADIAEFTNAFPHLGGGTVDGDLKRDGRLVRICHCRGGRRIQRSRRLSGSQARQKGNCERPAADSTCLVPH